MHPQGDSLPTPTTTTTTTRLQHNDPGGIVCGQSIVSSLIQRQEETTHSCPRMCPCAWLPPPPPPHTHTHTHTQVPNRRATVDKLGSCTQLPQRWTPWFSLSLSLSLSLFILEIQDGVVPQPVEFSTHRQYHHCRRMSMDWKRGRFSCPPKTHGTQQTRVSLDSWTCAFSHRHTHTHTKQTV